GRARARSGASRRSQDGPRPLSKASAGKLIARQKAADQSYLVQQDEGTVKLDQANVESARLNLDYAHINAPATGIAGALQIDPGNCSSSTSAAASTAPPPTSRPPSTRNDLTLIAPIGIILLI